MKLEIKAIRHSPTLSDDSEAFTANVYVNGKKVGSAKDTGSGGGTFLYIAKEHQPVAFGNARKWLDILDPNPIDLSKPWPKNGEEFSRTPAKDREEELPEGYLTRCVDILRTNHLILKQVKKAQTRISWLTTECRPQQFVYIKTKPELLSDQQKHQVESSNVFVEWLFDKESQYIADKLQYRDTGDGPLISVVVA